ncbi:histidine--tRNA ligase [Thioalkalivibrio sp. XN8]|uniref:histidine--tRNA ligase n=1 Tax=Thioalkalivibrio sp. XN8 TaxID=2712863 RepID=UPI0013ED1AE1|nr:histidine--tRNA ligase [Thioalkalivibrio sp. XN8]NGP53899.1 histidine--tRNA ligase [Thioalkalivibrio sp. XN8]
MSKAVQPIRGMNDILPESTATWQWVEAAARAVFAAYGYRELRVPLVERTELFSRSIGEVTDIVEKEMYSFTDRNGDHLSLRPEATASCVRAAISNGLIHNQQQRLWYAGPMFRYERPQKGRYRQFHQIGAEALGFAGPDIDAELILMSARLWRVLGLEGLQLELNSLGTTESRRAYRELLVEYFNDHRAALDEDSLRRLGQNPLRILDSKNPQMQAVVAGAPVITDHLDSESAEHYAQLRAALEAAGVAYRVNPRLVRGLDYYSRTVFEWLTDRLGAQAAVCSGGRYDTLVEQLGGRPTPAIGWALGMERLVELVAGLAPPPAAPHAYLVPLGTEPHALALAEALRDRVPGLRLQVHCGGGSLKSAMKKADRSGAELALILGAEELAADGIVVKPLRSAAEQEVVTRGVLVERLAQGVAPGRG